MFLQVWGVAVHKNTGRWGFMVDPPAQITWIVSNKHGVIGIIST